MTRKQKKALYRILVSVVLLVAAVSCFYTVDDKQQAVVTTFGKVTDITGPGLHFMLPFGIQQAHMVDVNVYQKIELGYVSDGNGNTKTVNDESVMITGDYNIVNVDFFVEYRVSDPVKALYASEEPVEILKKISQSCIRNVIGSYTVDSVLTTGKNEIQAA